MPLKEKALVGVFSWHCETLRQSVGSSILHLLAPAGCAAVPVLGDEAGLGGGGAAEDVGEAGAGRLGHLEAQVHQRVDQTAQDTLVRISSQLKSGSHLVD